LHFPVWKNSAHGPLITIFSPNPFFYILYFDHSFFFCGRGRLVLAGGLIGDFFRYGRLRTSAEASFLALSRSYPFASLG